MNLNEFSNHTATLPETGLMPVIFVGHGSPMNAIEHNEFTAAWRSIGEALPKPRAILSVSAHWETRGTQVTAMPRPRTIHDFYGFPEKLFQVQYPASGSPSVGDEIRELLLPVNVTFDQNWGLDHGTWSVLKHMYPVAGIPVLQLSLDHTLTPGSHYQLAQSLAPLRRKGILVIGSGNIVHNLRMINWHKPGGGDDWALEMNEKIKKLILSNNHQLLADYKGIDKDILQAIPTPEHFLPLLYALALQEKNESASFFNDKVVYGSISMTSLKIN